MAPAPHARTDALTQAVRRTEAHALAQLYLNTDPDTWMLPGRTYNEAADRLADTINHWQAIRWLCRNGHLEP